MINRIFHWKEKCPYQAEALIIQIRARSRNQYQTRQMSCAEAVVVALNHGLDGRLTDAQADAPVMRDVLFDPQTSGGLLIGCAEKNAFELKERLIAAGVKSTAIIGKVFDNQRGIINII